MAISDQPDDVEMIDSEAETYDSDDSDEDPTFDVLEETRSRFSDLSVKKKTKPRIDGDDEDDTGADVIESSVPELDEKDQKSFEIVQEIIEGGQVEKLKVEQCKVYLRKHGLRLTGKKYTLIDRIKEHFSIMNGGGEQKYPASSFVMNCKGDACTGDVVIFEQNVYEMFNIASRSANGPPCGTRVVAGRIVKDSYGAAKQQHTFTIEVLWSKGVKPLPPLHPLLIKGRNLYRLKTMRQRWEDEGERQKILMEKHNRGHVARSNREARIQEKEMRKSLRESRISGMKVQNGKQQTKRKTSPSQPIHSGIPSTQVSEHQNVQNPCQPQNQPLEQPKIIGAQIPQKKLCPIPNKNYLVPTVPFPGILGSQPLTSMDNLHQHMILIGKSYQKENINFNMLQNVGRAMDKQTVNNNIPLRSPLKSYEQNMCINSTRAQFLKHHHHHEEMLNINSFQNPSRRHNFNEGNKYHVTSVQLHGQGVHPPRGHFQIHGQFHEHKVPCRYYAQGRCHYGDRCKYLH